jgi:hypothetical protein
MGIFIYFLNKGDIMKLQLDIFFKNLNVATQNKVLDFYKLESEEEGNFDVLPLTTLEKEDEDEDEDD